MTQKHTFTATIQNAGGGGAYVEVPFDVEAAFGSKRPKVKALIEGLPYRGTLTRMGTDCHILGIRKEIREQVGKTIGDEITITVEADTEPRVVELPPELAQAFEREKEAAEVFHLLSYSHRKEYVGYITEAKKAETRARRVAQTIEMLKKGKNTKGLFMDLKQYLEHLYDYNYWANKRYLAVAETLTEEQLFRQQGHSWDNIHTVLVHMMSSERMWPQRWRGEAGEFLDPNDFPTLASIREYWVSVEQNMRDFLAGQSEASLLRNVTYTNPKGETFTLPLWQMVVHPPNHNTHHRGELAAMFALMEIPHPEEEVVQYFLTKSGQIKG